MLNPAEAMTERPTPETDAETIRDPYLGDIVTSYHARRLERQRDELLEVLERIDPFPFDEIEESWNGDTVYCEITVKEIRMVRTAIASVKGGA